MLPLHIHLLIRSSRKDSIGHSWLNISQTVSTIDNKKTLFLLFIYSWRFLCSEHHESSLILVFLPGFQKGRDIEAAKGQGAVLATDGAGIINYQ
jgi:hypothetical protein